MSIQKYTSDVKTINWNNLIVYDSLSNLEFLNILMSPENMERVKQQLGDKADKFNIEDFSADRDSCSFSISPVGKFSLRIANREKPKAIKLVSEQDSPIGFKFWIQILPINDTSCKIKLTLHTELNMMMKMMVGKKLDNGLNQIADAFTQIPFGTIQSLNQDDSSEFTEAQIIE